MRAIILAGGFGTRLKGVIGEDTPKPMAPVEGEPFLAHYLRYLHTRGVTDAVLSVHHCREVIKSHFKNHFEGVNITYAEEEKPLGTGGAVKFALSRLVVKEPVLVLNGDSFVEIDLAEMVQAHHQANTTLTIALCRMQDCSRYGEAMFDADHRITAFAYPGRAGAGWISMGAYIVSPNIFDGYDLPEAFSFEADFQRPYGTAIRPLAWLAEGYFIDIGVPEDYARAQSELRKRIKAAA